MKKKLISLVMVVVLGAVLLSASVFMPPEGKCLPVCRLGRSCATVCVRTMPTPAPRFPIQYH